jgi:hypothetical protein
MFKRTELLFGNDSKTITETFPTDDIKYLFRLIRESDHHRSNNYNMLYDAYAYSVTYLNDIPALCSSAWERPLFNGSIRLGTRYGVNPQLKFINFGKGTENFMRVDVTDHIRQQIEICKRLGGDSFFLSQESRLGNRRIKCISETLSKHTEIKWSVTEERVQVTPNPSHLQYLIFNKSFDFDYTAE